MKKLLTLIITFMLVLLLVTVSGCGSLLGLFTDTEQKPNNITPTDNLMQTDDEETGAQDIANGSSSESDDFINNQIDENQQNGTENEDVSDDTPSGSGGRLFGGGNSIEDDADIPNNGIPPSVVPPFENHRGDRGFFYTVSDDYVVGMVNYGDYQIYGLLNFENGIVVSIMEKTVYEDEFTAMRKTSNILDEIRIDNVVYSLPVTNKDEHFIIGMTLWKIFDGKWPPYFVYDILFFSKDVKDIPHYEYDENGYFIVFNQVDNPVYRVNN